MILYDHFFCSYHTTLGDDRQCIYSFLSKEKQETRLRFLPACQKSPCHFERSEAESRNLRIIKIKNVQIAAKMFRISVRRSLHALRLVGMTDFSTVSQETRLRFLRF